MYIRGVRLLNWMAFAGEHRIGPLPTGPIAVVGRYVENSRRSNWSGKTAWLEAIRFALTGAHRKRIDDAIITHGAGRMEVELEMSTGLVITRVRPRGGPTVLRVTEPGREALERSAAEEYLARTLRLPLEDFDNTLWFGQGDVLALCAKTSGVRRDIFSRWLELDLWERAGARAMRTAREARSALEVARSVDLGPPPRLEEERKLERAQLEEERALLDQDLKSIELSLEENAAATARLDEVRKRQAEAERAARALLQVREELSALPPLSSEEQIQEVEDELREALSLLDAARREREEVKHLLAGRFDGQCPVTCEACPVAEEVGAKREAFVERGRRAEEAYGERHRASSAIRSKLREVREAEQKRTRLIATMNEVAKRAREARKAYEAAAATVDFELAEAAGRVREELRASRATVAARIREVDALLGALTGEERQAEQYREREAKRVEALEQAERNARVAQLVARALGSSGIPARIAAASLAGLEARANALLSGLGLSFTLTWERELSDPAPACGECGHIYAKRARAKECPGCGTPRGRKKSDELDILVDDGSGEVEDVRAKSGGAKVLVASAIRLAGGMLLRERRGSPLEVAFVDEPFGELDLENRDALARTFAGLLSSVGLEQAFVVSHDAQLLAGLPARIIVTREGSSSRLDLEA